MLIDSQTDIPYVEVQIFHGSREIASAAFFRPRGNRTSWAFHISYQARELTSDTSECEPAARFLERLDAFDSPEIYLPGYSAPIGRPILPGPDRPRYVVRSYAYAEGAPVQVHFETGGGQLAEMVDEFLDDASACRAGR